MPRAALVELDFFGLEKQTTASGPPEHRWTSSPGMVAGARSGYVHDHIRSGIPSSANPTIPSVENAVQFAPCDPFFVSLPASSFKRDHPNGFPAPTPAHSPLLRPTSDKNARIAPMTIFYNGKMTVVDVPRIMAENILKLAMEECSKNPESENPETAMPAPSHQHQWFESLNKYLPMARRKSLQRFLEKRKERLTAASPYHDPAHLPPRVSGFKN